MVSCTHTEIYSNDNSKHLGRCWHGFTFVPSDPFITFVHTSPSVISPQRANNHVSLLKYNQRVFIYQGQMLWDFPGVPGVKNLPSCAGGMGQAPAQSTGVPHTTKATKSTHHSQRVALGTAMKTQHRKTNKQKPPQRSNVFVFRSTTSELYAISFLPCKTLMKLIYKFMFQIFLD